MIENQTLDNFNFQFVTLRNHKREIQDKTVITGWLKSPKQKLILLGDPGVGKTHLAKAINLKYHEIRKNDPDIKEIIPSGTRADKLKMLRAEYHAQVLYELFRDLAVGGNACIDAKEDKRYLLRCELFTLDDLGSEQSTEKDVFPRGFLLLLDQLGPRKVIITTNLSFEDLAERYKEKITSRLCHEAVIVIIEAEDFRKRGLK